MTTPTQPAAPDALVVVPREALEYVVRSIRSASLYPPQGSAMDGALVTLEAAITASGGAVLDAATVQALRRVLDTVSHYRHFLPDEVFSDHPDDLARIDAALPKEDA
jgi:hypothetical protein